MNKLTKMERIKVKMSCHPPCELHSWPRCYPSREPSLLGPEGRDVTWERESQRAGGVRGNRWEGEVGWGRVRRKGGEELGEQEEQEGRKQKIYKNGRGGDSSQPGSAPPLIRIHELPSYIKSLYDTWPLMQSWLRTLKIKSRR